MSVSSTSVGKLGYGAFYLPVFAYGYFATEGVRILPIVRQYLPMIPWFNETLLFSILTGVTLLGAIQIHGIARAIYGSHPSSNPKQGSVQIRHSLAIVLGVNVDRVPKVAPRVFSSGIISEIVEYFQHLTKRTYFEQNRKMWKREFGPLTQEPARKHRLEVAIQELADIPSLIHRGNILRILYFVPIGLTYSLTRLSFLILTVLLFVGNTSFIMFLLWIGQFVLLFRKKFWAPIPTTIYPEDLSDVHKAEYSKGNEEKMIDTNEGRIDSKK
jgi:hypothetical protein